MIIKILKIILGTSIIKTIYFNIKYFGIKGLILPVFVGYNVELKKLKGKIVIENMKTGHIRLGIYCPGNIPEKTPSSFYNDGTIFFKQKASFGKGFRICNHGNLKIGNNFGLTASSSVICEQSIIFGDNCTVSWGCEIMDTDLHKIFNSNGEKINNPKK